MILALCPNPSIDKQLFLKSLSPGSVNKCRKEQAFPGGKGVHVALALRELDMPVILGGLWGGPTGEWLRNECKKKEIRSIGPDIEGWTRTCLTLLADEGPAESEIIEHGPFVSSTDIDDLMKEVELVAPTCKSVVVSGSWPAGSPDDVYLRLKIICDQNRIPLWIDASGDRLSAALKTHPFGIHINLSEAITLFGKDLKPEDAARKLSNYCRVAAVTNGADGLYLATDNQLVHTQCFVEQVISTVGSGDCLTAGLVLGWARGLPEEEIAKLATACGAANCIRPDLGMLNKKDVDNLIPKVQNVSTSPL